MFFMPYLLGGEFSFRGASHLVTAPFSPILNALGASQEIKPPPQILSCGTGGQYCWEKLCNSTGKGHGAEIHGRALGGQECSQSGTFWAVHPRFTPQPFPPSSQLSLMETSTSVRPRNVPGFNFSPAPRGFTGTSTHLNEKQHKKTVEGCSCPVPGVLGWPPAPAAGISRDVSPRLAWAGLGWSWVPGAVAPRGAACGPCTRRRPGPGAGSAASPAAPPCTPAAAGAAPGSRSCGSWRPVGPRPPHPRLPPATGGSGCGGRASPSPSWAGGLCRVSSQEPGVGHCPLF